MPTVVSRSIFIDISIALDGTLAVLTGQVLANSKGYRALLRSRMPLGRYALPPTTKITYRTVAPT